MAYTHCLVWMDAKLDTQTYTQTDNFLQILTQRSKTSRKKSSVTVLQSYSDIQEVQYLKKYIILHSAALIKIFLD